MTSLQEIVQAGTQLMAAEVTSYGPPSILNWAAVKVENNSQIIEACLATTAQLRVRGGGLHVKKVCAQTVHSKYEWGIFRYSGVSVACYWNYSSSLTKMGC